MKFGFALNLSPEINKFLEVFNRIEQEISDITEQGIYGDGINELYIGIICVAPQFEAFFKPRKPRYEKEKKTYEKEGIKYKDYKTLQYEIKLDFDYMKNSDEEAAKRKLVESVFNSLDVIETIKEIKSFDLKTLKKELGDHFKKQSLLP